MTEPGQTNDLGPNTMDEVIDRLLDEFGDTFDPATIGRIITASRAELGDCTVTAFIPVLVHRAARERLREEVKLHGSDPTLGR